MTQNRECRCGYSLDDPNHTTYCRRVYDESDAAASTDPAALDRETGPDVCDTNETQDRLLQSDGLEVQPCPQGRTDYDACMAPFRYCPVKGCNRAETPPVPVCAAYVVGCAVTYDHEHVEGGGWRLTDAGKARSGPWAKGIIDQTLGEPVLAELRDNPINEATLDPHAKWVHHKIHRVIWRHAFTDHDCQTTGCLAMMLAESPEIRDVVIEAYERGKRDALGEPWRPGEYDEAATSL